MLKGVDENGNLQNVNVSEDGAISVKIDGTIEQTSDKEVTLLSEVLVVGTSATEKNVNKKITSIMVANYSETSDITIAIGSQNLEIGANLALEFPLNVQVSSLNITATEDNTKMQLVVKGVE